MTIRHFSQEYRGLDPNGHAKQTWFLVPSVALAVQQTQTLRVNLPYKVATACHTGTIVDSLWIHYGSWIIANESWVMSVTNYSMKYLCCIICCLLLW